jgi:hypothetical protein
VVISPGKEGFFDIFFLLHNNYLKTKVKSTIDSAGMRLALNTLSFPHQSARSIRESGYQAMKNADR